MKLELRSITKRFGPLVANDHIDLDVEPGQIHCLLGENGAGKSTLMNILYGLYTADEGEILIDGERQQFDGPGDAMAAGIGMVHQHFMLVPVFTVAENVMLGHEPTQPGGRLDMAQARELVKVHSARLGFDLDPDALVEDLPVGVQQRVEIVKALSRDAKVLVFDEPTAVLTPQETDELIEIMRELRDQGTAIVFISHKLREVRAVADTITIIRHGAVVGNAPPETSPEELANLMVGRPVNLKVSKGESSPGDVALKVHDLTVLDSRGQRVVDQISFDIRSGEVLAVAGVQGNGQTELVEAIMGLRPAAGGQVLVHGQDVSESTVRDIIQAGVGYIPEDRHRDAIVAELSISENIFLNRSFSPTLVKHASIRTDALRDLTDGLIQQYDVRTPHSRVPIGKLSGGNQQKVVIARELDRELTLFVASQPTRGIDVGSIEFVHNQIVAARDAGVGVLVVSTELDEVTALADRIMVMFHGRVMGIVPATTSREQLGLLMAGVEQSKQEDVA